MMLEVDERLYPFATKAMEVYPIEDAVLDDDQDEEVPDSGS